MILSKHAAATRKSVDEVTVQVLEKVENAVLVTGRAAAVAEAAQTATYEMERPLMSISVFNEELLRLAGGYLFQHLGLDLIWSKSAVSGLGHFIAPVG